jgi:hypothetical protein
MRETDHTLELASDAVPDAQMDVRIVEIDVGVAHLFRMKIQRTFHLIFFE